MRALPTDEECAFVEPFVVPVRSLGGGPACDRRPVPPAIFRIARLGAWWRDLPADPGRRKPAFRRFPRRAASGLRDVMLETLADGDGDRIAAGRIAQEPADHRGAPLPCAC